MAGRGSESIARLFNGEDSQQQEQTPQRLRAVSVDYGERFSADDVHLRLLELPEDDFRRVLIKEFRATNPGIDLRGRGIWDVKRDERDPRVATLALHRAFGLMVLAEDVDDSPAGTIIGTEDSGLFNPWRARLGWRPRWPPSPPAVDRKLPLLA